MAKKKAKKSKRRGSGEGTIGQRTDGRWMGSITIGRNEKGQQKRRYVYGATQAEVSEKLAKLRGEVLDGSMMLDDQLTVGQFLDRWLANSVKMSVRPTTYQSYSELTRLHLKPNIGSIKLAKLSPIHVQGLYAKLSDDGKTPRRVQMCHAVLHRALRMAVKWGLAARNVTDAVDRPRVPRREMQSLDVGQVGTLLTAIEGERLRGLWQLAVYSGCRIGELIPLQWSDIDLRAGTVSIRRGQVEVAKQVIVSEPKTARSRRTIKLPREAVQALVDHRARMLVEGLAGNPLVFINEAGGMISRNDCRSSWERIRKLTKMPKLRIHDLRHTNASLLLSAGVHAKVVSERLGHSTISLTLDTYSHVAPSLQEEAADKLSEVLKRG